MEVDDSTLEVCLATALVATNVLSSLHNRRKKKARQHYVKQWMARKSRNVYNSTLREMCLEDQQAFYNFQRMSRKNFAELLELVSTLTRKQDTKIRKAVSSAQLLSITLLFDNWLVMFTLWLHTKFSSLIRVAYLISIFILILVCALLPVQCIAKPLMTTKPIELA